jgi:hypothetical protein
MAQVVHCLPYMCEPCVIPSTTRRKEDGREGGVEGRRKGERKAGREEGRKEILLL